MTSTDDGPSDPDDEWMLAARTHYDPERDDELSTEVVYAVAEAEGVSPTELTAPPLYDAIDIAAVGNAFFGPDVRREPRKGVGTVEFRYADYLIEVRSDGWIRVCRPA